MAFENLFVRTKKSLGGIQLDATIQESHSNIVRLTKNPIELGADITDHAIIEPKKLNIVAEVSDTPLGFAAVNQIIDLITGLFGSSTSENVTRSNAAYNAMVQLMENREPLQVQTKLRLYNNMVITNIAVVQDKDTSRIVSMGIDLEEAIITESEIIQLTADQIAAGTPRIQASPTVDAGRQEATTPNGTQETSVLKTITEWLQ